MASLKTRVPNPSLILGKTSMICLATPSRPSCRPASSGRESETACLAAIDPPTAVLSRCSTEAAVINKCDAVWCLSRPKSNNALQSGQKATRETA